MSEAKDEAWTSGQYGSKICCTPKKELFFDKNNWEKPMNIGHETLHATKMLVLHVHLFVLQVIISHSQSG
jgi:hypothetical protein